MPAPQAVLTLVENCERNLDAYRDGKYNETQVRRDFIDPLFKAVKQRAILSRLGV